MDLKFWAPIIIVLILFAVIGLYFMQNVMNHSKAFMWRRFVNWFPLGMSYAFLYMARYNLNVSKNALGSLMSKEDFGIIFGVGTVVYGLSFLLNGPLVDKIGGKKGILLATLGASIANVLMGGVTYLFLKGQLKTNLTLAMASLYALNMFFQSYGAVSIIKVKAYWFHVRERGVFGAIFGTLISFGVYFAFDWGQMIVDAAALHPTKSMSPVQNFIRNIFAIDTGTTDAIWLVFLIPAFFLVIWALLDTWLIKDTPGEANFDDFDTHDASSGEMEVELSKRQLIKKILTNPILLTICGVEFMGGVIRNGVMQWYFVFAKEVPQTGAEIISGNWGFWNCITGIMGSFIAGWISDHVFHSRRGPPAVLMNAIIFLALGVMSLVLFTNPIGVGIAALFIVLAVIGVHGLMSGTAAADFGGRKATATASGIADGFVYLGSGLQSFCLGYLVTRNWAYWPVFLIPFAALGMYLAYLMWRELPEATKKYLMTVENVDVEIFTSKKRKVQIHTSTISLKVDDKA